VELGKIRARGELNRNGAILVGNIELAQADANVPGGNAYDRVIAGVIGGFAPEDLAADGAFLDQFTPLQGPVHDVAKEELAALTAPKSAAFEGSLQLLANLTDALFIGAEQGSTALVIHSQD
jgi:hypothetical protein